MLFRSTSSGSGRSLFVKTRNPADIFTPPNSVVLSDAKVFPRITIVANPVPDSFKKIILSKMVFQQTILSFRFGALLCYVIHFLQILASIFDKKIFRFSKSRPLFQRRCSNGLQTVSKWFLETFQRIQNEIL